MGSDLWPEERANNACQTEKNRRCGHREPSGEGHAGRPLKHNKG